jgi:hypothetical protein
MSNVSGYSIIKSPCCGSLFTTPQYGSINWSAKEYWTDGRRVAGHPLSDGDLRLCTCGCLYLLHQAEHVGMVAGALPAKLGDGGADDFNIPDYLRLGSKIPPPTEADLDAVPVKNRVDRHGLPVPPDALYVRDNALEAVLSTGLAEADDVELIVRRRYWRYLNDQYREAYRAHRKSVDGAANQPAVAKTLWSKLAGKLHSAVTPASAPIVQPERVFTVPQYTPATEQKENMEALMNLLLRSEKPDPVEIAELHRELGDYHAAQKAIYAFKGVEHTASRLIRQLIAEKVNEPMRWV